MFAVDTHVHLYPVFDLSKLLRASVARWLADAEPIGIRLTAGLLCVTEGDDAGAFDRLRNGQNATLHLQATGEETSLYCSDLDLPVYLVRGRQIVTREGLEVLAIGIPAEGPDRQLTLEETVRKVDSEGGVAILPWGAGKWWGRRGAILRDYLARTDRPDVLLGDNGGRPRFWTRCHAFQQARARGVAIVPGSDPLPFAGEESTAGRGSILVRSDLDSARPTATLLHALRNRAFTILTPAGAETPGRFFLNQIRMQRRKRLGR